MYSRYTGAGTTGFRSPSGLPVIRNDCAQLIRCCKHPRRDFNDGAPSRTTGIDGNDAFIVAASVAMVINAILMLRVSWRRRSHLDTSSC